MDNQVFIVRCPTYEQADQKIAELMTMMNGMSNFTKPNEKIVLKINLLQPAKPEKAVTTHPSIVAAVAGLVKNEGAIPVIADSPGAGYKYNKKSLEKIYNISGIYKTAQKTDIELNFDTTFETVSFPQGKLIKRFEVINPVLKADGVFNLCKLKTHLFMHMTGAVKNNFGVIPGLLKPGYHAKLHDTGHFANMLLDLMEYVSPRVSIMDAVIGMEGEGPGAAGEPRHIGLLLASKNPLALDIVAGEIIGLNRENNPVLIAAEKRGLHPNSIQEVQVIGPDISDLLIPDYKFPATIFKGTGIGNTSWWQKALEPLFKNSFSVRPRIIEKNCTACGACFESCPMNVIKIIEDKYAHIDEKGCIRCYCCHEMCPNNAIELRKKLLYRILSN